MSETTPPISTTDPVEYPILVVRFNPLDLPAGAVDLRDLHDTLAALQQLLLARVQHQYDRADLEFPELQPFRYIVAAATPSCFECHLICGALAHDGLWTGLGASSNTLIAPLAGLSGLTLLILDDARQEMLARTLRAVPPDTQRLVARELDALRLWLHALSGPHAPEQPADLLEAAAPALKQLADLAAKETYQPEGIELRAGSVIVRPESDRLTLNQLIINPGSPVALHARAARHILAGLDTGKRQLRATYTGVITELDLARRKFCLTTPDHTRRLICRYTAAREADLREHVALGASVRVTGTPYRRWGADDAGLPAHLHVHTVEPAP
jgi:hypothetical protein